MARRLTSGSIILQGLGLDLCALVVGSACASAPCPPASHPSPPPSPALVRQPSPAPANAPSVTAGATPTNVPPSLAAERALRLVRGFHAEPRALAHASFSENFRRSVSETKLLEILREVEGKVGKFEQARVVDETASKLFTTVYVVAFFERGTRRYEVTLNADGVVHGLLVKPFADDSTRGPGPADGYVAKRSYALPTRGPWHVSQGGSDPGGNQHIGNPHQWYAFDLQRKAPDGKEWTGEGKQNADHPAWGEAVVAPADGTIAMVVSSVPDHPPGHRDRYFVPGNLIVIEHGEGEFSFLAHLRQGSISVRKGQRVKRGQELAKVGNSGNSTGPHLHWHLATEADMSRGHGLPIRFMPLDVNGTRVEAPLPTQGDTLQNPAPPGAGRR